MAKLTCFLVLLVTVILCAEAVRIDPPPPPTLKPGKFFPSTRITKKDDPRCKKDGMFANPNDCTRYIKCKNGESQDMNCPDGFKFDSKKYCTPDKNADCGKSGQRDSKQEVKCPQQFGNFAYVDDCHKYIECERGVPTIVKCPPHYVYNDVNGGCIQGEICPPNKQHEANKCSSENDCFPSSNCLFYIECINWKGTEKKCPEGTAFNPKLKRCTKDWIKHCRNNDLRDIIRTE
ncbi:uncharacterized protein NPIL_37351 [Nephila pilipes]|uniref:Chitin-binding type-2 domain-containing protein n=1 Tax=Nephila pilipes TaxID=299642 RepID=A0A8X6U8R7_NEPPI|nr:uncharacterized protein NPIL_37351 [Nephila pilipes]